MRGKLNSHKFTLVLFRVLGCVFISLDKFIISLNLCLRSVMIGILPRSC